MNTAERRPQGAAPTTASSVTAGYDKRPQRRTFLKNQVVVDAMKRARAEALHNRHLVLAHPDLAQQLVEFMGYERPGQWNGYVPPRFYHDGFAWRPNSTPARTFLMDLVVEAIARAS